MGIFNFGGNKKDGIKDPDFLKRIEQELNFKIFNFDINELTDEELTIDNEVEGITRVASKNIDKDITSIFDYISISKYDFGFDEIYYSKYFDNERELVSMLNKIYKALDKYDGFYSKITTSDLNKIRLSGSQLLKEVTTYYDNGINYTTYVISNNQGRSLSLIFKPRKSIHYELEVYIPNKYNF